MPQLNLNALLGMPLSETFHIYGTIAYHCVVILMDSGSTHNFLQSRLATFLHLLSTPTSTMPIMIGDGTILDCASMCPNILVTIQSHTFFVDLYPLPIGGAYIVLGVQCLKLLGQPHRCAPLPELSISPTTQKVCPDS